jgi:hypothetical protein
MNLRTTGSAFTGVGCLSYVLVMTVFTWWTDRSLDFWVAVMSDGAKDNCPLWISFLTSIFGGPIVMPGNIITEIIRFADLV